MTPSIWGRAFPTRTGPCRLREVAARQLIEGPNQYPPSKGLAVLRQAVAAHARKFYGLEYDPEDEVVITSGGTEAVTGALMAMAGVGDEVVMIEPTYDSYRPMAEGAGAVVKAVKLEPPGWRLTEAALRAVIGPKTRAILINSPHNPAGRVFSRDELEALARVVTGTDIVVICDEVYEHLVYDGKPHIPFATLPGMRERTLQDRFGRQDLLADRLEGRLGDGSARAGQRGDQGAPVPHLHHFAGAADRAWRMA